MPFVLDACAMIAFLRGEAGSEIVEELLAKDESYVGHAINMCEVYYDFLKAGCEEATAAKVINDLEAVGVNTRKDMDFGLYSVAGRQKAKGSICSAVEDKLRQHIDFTPSSTSPVQQLIEVARTFKLPMAIEWLREEVDSPNSSLQFDGGTVLELIEAIVRQSAGHEVSVDQHIVYVFSPQALKSSLNFLNMRIAEYGVTQESLLGAEALLRTKINMALYPELYRTGYGGGLK